MKSKIKVGLWGIGRAGWHMHCGEMDLFKDYFEIVAGCDLIEERTQKFNERYPEAKIYNDPQKFLSDSNIEMVSIATYSPDHVNHAQLALESGKYVFLEKPIALNYKGALKLADLAKKYPGKLFFRQNRRFEPCFQHVMEIIHSGLIGDVFEIKLCRHNFMRRDDWQTIIECGGGQLNNWGPHLIDHGLRFLESPVKSVWSNLKCVAARGDAEDHFKAILEGENGRIIDIEVSGGIALPSPVYAVYGTKGSIISDDEQDLKIKYLDPAFELKDIKSKKGSPSWNAGYGDPSELHWRRMTIMVEPKSKCSLTDIYRHVYAAIRENVPYPIKVEEAVEVVRVTEMIKNNSPFVMK